MNRKTIKILTLSVIVSNYLFAGGVANCPTDGSGNYLVLSNSDNSSIDSTLRACAYRAGNSGSDATVTFNNDMNIVLANPIVLNGANHLTVDGGVNTITVNGNNTTEVMVDNNSNKVTLKNLMLQDGLDDDGVDGGGALYIDSSGTFDIQNVTFSDNNVSGDSNGAAIYIKSKSSKDTTVSVNITDSKFNNNGSTKGTIYVEYNVSISISKTEFTNNITRDGGAGLFAGKDVTIQIDDVNFTNNKLTHNDDFALAIFVDENSSLSVNNSLFSQNDASGLHWGSDGVALISAIKSKNISINSSEFVDNNSSMIFTGFCDSVSIDNSVFSGNDNLDDYYRHFYFYDSAVHISNSQITDNTHRGELMYSVLNTLSIENSKFNSNISDDNSSLVLSILANATASSTEFDNNTNGATFVSYMGTSTLTSSSITNNSSVIQVYGISANMDIKNTTISTNVDINGSIFVSDTNLTIDSSTIYNNINTDLSTPSAGIYSVNNSIVDMANSILMNNTISGVEKNINQELGEVIYSIIATDVDAGTLFANQVGVNPKLKALSYNGVNTKTHALESDSPAIDTGATMLSTDQRGKKRDDFPDIGAYEYQNMTLSPIYYLLF